MISLLDRYIATRLLVATALVLAVLLALMMFFVVVDSLGDYGQANFKLYQLVRYTLLSQPRRVYEIFPVATLIGTLLGLSALAVNAELVAMRAAGVSVSRIVFSAMKVGLLLAIVATALGEFVVPATENQAQVGRATALARGLQKKGSGLWLRDQNNFVNIREVLPDSTLLQVTIYSFTEDMQLRSQTRAERAVFEGDGWRLEEVRASVVSDRGIKVRRVDKELWPTSLTRDVVGVFAVKPEGLSILHLVRYIDHLRNNAQSTELYRLTLWQKLLMPIAVMVMVLLATPFTFAPIRGGGLSRRIFGGIVLGLAFVLATRLFGHFGLLYGLSPFFGAVLPILLFLGGALVMLRRAS
jgi:lipopolysaccharide export system permease protein